MSKRGFFFSMILDTSVAGLIAALFAPPALAYPPAVGILGPSRDCLACHANNGPWKDDANVIVDVLDKASGKSLKQPDDTFLIAARRGETKTVLTVIGTRRGDAPASAYRNAWLYVDPDRIGDPSALSKFAPGWSVNLPMSCRLVGDVSEAYAGAPVTVLPMTVRPGDDARDADIELQVMLTKGESVKGKAQEGMLGNYFKRKVHLKVMTGAEGK